MDYFASVLAVISVDDVLVDRIGGGLAKDECSNGNHDDTIDHQPMPTVEERGPTLKGSPFQDNFDE